MEKARATVALFSSKAKGALGRMKRTYFGDPRGEENVSNRSSCQGKKAKHDTNKAADTNSIEEEVKQISLHQNRFKCPSPLMIILALGVSVILTFPLSFQPKLKAFLEGKGVDVDSCFQTQFMTASGPVIALLGEVVKNDPVITKPWELFRDESDGVIDGSRLYGGGGGIVIKILGGNASEEANHDITITYEELAGKTMDLWTEIHVADFDGLLDGFNSMDMKHKLKALVHMSKELDPYQQIWCGQQFYKDYVQARSQLTREQDRAIDRLRSNNEKATAKLKGAHSEELEAVRCKRLTAKEVTPKDIHDIYHDELKPAKLRKFSETMDKDIADRRKSLVSCFSKFRDTLIGDGLMEKWCKILEDEFPLTHQGHLSTLLPDDHKYGEDPVDDKKKYAALWEFIAGVRKRDDHLFIEIATVFTLSLMTASTSDKAVKTMSSLGIAASKSSAERALSEINKLNSKPWSWLSKEKWLVMCFDNMVYNLPQKVQSEGSSSHTIDGTSRFSRKVEPFVPPNELHFTTDEGQPGVTYTDQRIPAPIGLPPIELLDSTKQQKLLSLDGGIRETLRPETFQREILESQDGAAIDFDVSIMPATDGKRSDAYLKLLRRNKTYVMMWQCLSSESTIAKSRPFYAPDTATMRAVQKVIQEARGKELKNARQLHKELVRTWFPQLDDVALTFLHSVSVFSEKTTEGTAKVLVELLIDAGVLVVGANEKISLGLDWEERVIFMCGDAYSVNNGYSFAKKTETSTGQYSDSYETNKIISQALTRILWFPGDLHIEFHILKGIFTIHYPGFIHPFQAAGQITRLVQDPTKCFQLAKTFVKVVYEQCYRGLAFSWWSGLESDCGITTVHEAVTSFEAYLESMHDSKDEARRYLARFIDLCEVYFLFSDCVERQDAYGQELILNHFQPIFYFLGMTNYKEVTWREHEMLYSKERSVLERETLRRHRTIRLNEGKNAIGTDTFCELLNLKTVSMNKSKTIDRCSERSSAVTTVSHSDEFRKNYVCNENVDAPPKSSTKKRTGYIRDRVSELFLKAGLFEEREDRKMKDVDLYALLDDLATRLPEKLPAEENEDDEITLAEQAAADRKDTIAAFVKRVIPKKGTEKSTLDDAEADARDGDGDVAMADGEATAGTSRLNASGIKKILLANRKIRIGTSHQERMVIDPKKVATLNPFKKGKELIEKDNVKEKRDKAKEEHDRKCNLTELCYKSSIRKQMELQSEGDIDLHPSAEHHEAKQKIDKEYSAWT